MIRSVMFILVWGSLPVVMGVERGVLLETELEGGQTVVEGKVGLADVEVSPASTFKVVLAWAGLEYGVIDGEERLEVRDGHVPGTPRAIDLRQAMYYSSNDFFIPLARRVTRPRLEEVMTRSGLYPNGFDPGWLGEAWKPVRRGGATQVTPRGNHEFMCRLASGKLGLEPEVSEQLFAVLRWPSPRADVKVYGKTGVWGGAVWYNGFGIEDGKTRVVTVRLIGSVERRQEAIGLFYKRFGLEWDASLSSQVE